MKVTGSKIGGATRIGAGAPSAPASGRFAVSGAGPARESPAAARTAGVSGVASLDALLALQELEGPVERRRRAVGRASRILDVLEDMKLALLDGDMQPGDLARLLTAVREERSSTEDPRLEGVLDEIETRAAVELAKREVSGAAA
jgi:hypothetical protein